MKHSKVYGFHERFYKNVSQTHSITSSDTGGHPDPVVLHKQPSFYAISKYALQLVHFQAYSKTQNTFSSE